MCLTFWHLTSFWQLDIFLISWQGRYLPSCQGRYPPAKVGTCWTVKVMDTEPYYIRAISGNLSVRTVYSPTPEMAIIHRTMHNAIHAVREQQGRAVTRSLLNQQKAIAASKLQCNIQIKRTSTPEHPPMSNVPPRRARARSEKANGVTSGSSEESDTEPQTSRMARFQALKMRFETPTKSEEESQSHGTFKRQRLFRKTSSQSATDCPSKEYRTPGPSRRLNGTASEGDWARPSSQEDQLHCRYCT